MEKPEPTPPYSDRYPMQPTPQVQTVVQSVMQSPQVGPQPVSIECRSCRNTVLTNVEHSNKIQTHMISLLLCVVGCWLCCCIPYCMDSCKNVNHYCPHCNAYIGTYAN